MRYKVVLYLLGRLLFIIAGFMLVPAFVGFYYHEFSNSWHFLYTAGAAGFFGAILFLRYRKRKDEGIGLRDGFLLVTLTWIVISFFGAFPLYFSHYFHSFIDAFFESTSGFTTTGASVLSDVEVLPRCLLFWRNFTQWIGGMGIIVLAVAILPQLSIGGMQLLKNRPWPSSKTYDKNYQIKTCPENTGKPPQLQKTKDKLSIMSALSA